MLNPYNIFPSFTDEINLAEKGDLIRNYLPKGPNS